MLSLIFISLISTSLAVRNFTGFNGTGLVMLETPNNTGLVFQIIDKRNFSTINPYANASFELFPKNTTSTGFSAKNVTKNGTTLCDISFKFVIQSNVTITDKDNNSTLKSSEINFGINYNLKLG